MAPLPPPHPGGYAEFRGVKNHDTAAWKVRADAKGGLDGLVKSAIAGLNAMPPKGTCSDCSDDELRAAIQEMSGL